MAIITKNLGRVVGADGQDGRGISKIVKTATSGLVDTYTIMYSDNTTSTFTVTNGKDGTNGSGGAGSCLLTEQTITIGETGDVPVTGIELDYSTMTINTGESFQLAATIYPANASNNIVTWKSSDSSIATCVEGFVTGVKGGKVTITASSLENSSIKTTCTVNVVETSSDGKVYLSDLTPVKEGSILKKDGKTEFAVTGGNYYSIPYSEGMYIITGMNAGWVNNYPSIIVDDGGTITIPEATKTEAFYYSTAYGYSATLSGFSENAKVYVNTYVLTEQYRDYVYYIEGNGGNTPEEPDTPVTPEEPEIPDVPDVPTGTKVYFSDLTPVNVNVLLKNDGVTEYSSNYYQYYQIPYSEGMQISTYYNRSFINSYSPFIVKDGNNVQGIKGEETVVAGSLCQYTITLAGYSTETKVYVNTRADGEEKLKYYIEGGNN